jgi:hypothetical protein
MKGKDRPGSEEAGPDRPQVDTLKALNGELRRLLEDLHSNLADISTLRAENAELGEETTRMLDRLKGIMDRDSGTER